VLPQENYEEDFDSKIKKMLGIDADCVPVIPIVSQSQASSQNDLIKHSFLERKEENEQFVEGHLASLNESI